MINLIKVVRIKLIFFYNLQVETVMYIWKIFFFAENIRKNVIIKFVIWSMNLLSWSNKLIDQENFGILRFAQNMIFFFGRLHNMISMFLVVVLDLR